MESTPSMIPSDVPQGWWPALLHRHPGDAEQAQRSWLQALAPGGLVLFGAGYQGELVLADLRGLGCGDRVRCFVDNQASKWGQSLGGVPIEPPSFLASLPRETPILIASAHHRAMAAQLEDMGFTAQVRVMDTTALRLGHFHRPTLEAAAGLLEALRASLGDARSQEVLEGVLAFRLTGDIRFAEAVCEPLHYFPPELVSLGPEEVFIDGGAFDGDTVRAFLEATGGPFEAVHAFEPDPRNFARLQAWIGTHPRKGDLHAHPEALFSHQAELSFDLGPSMSSCLAPAGQVRVQAAGLDEVLAGGRASFIKYDLEGAEPEALRGAEATIRRWRPTLAISIYHAAEDLWRLPAQIRALTPGYRYHLRHASFLSFETVYFAIPGPGPGPTA